MEDLTFLEIFFNDCNSPCCVTDVDTYEIVYSNRAMDELLKDTSGYTGRKCYEVVYGHSEPCDFCPNDEIVSDRFIENRVHNDRLGKHFLVNNLLLEYGGRKLNLCKYYLPNFLYTNQVLTYDEAMLACSEILNQGKIENIINACLKLLGQFFHCKKVFLYQIDMEKNQLNRLNFWTEGKDAIGPEHTADPKQLAYVLERLSSRNESGILTLDELLDFYGHDSTEAQESLRLGYKNGVFSPIFNRDNEVVGFIFLEGELKKDEDYRLLIAISRFVEQSFYHTDSKMLDEIKRMTDLDILTGCLPRGKYVAQLAKYLRTQPTNLSVIFANVNGLRKTNEILGSEHGDRLICESSRILKRHFKEPIYRIGGDEFVIFIEDTPESTLKERMDNLHLELSKEEVRTFAVGYCWKDGRIDVGKMVAESDALMYINKQEYYHNTKSISNDVKHNVLYELLKAIENGEFMVYLQPQFSLKDDKIVGAEALIRRYNKKEGKMIFPDEFISLYENNSIIRHVDLFVLDKVCQLINEWRAHDKHLAVSVNLSRVTLQEHDIVNTIKNIVDKNNVPHKYIVIEVTERVGLVENNVASDLITELRDEGFRISLDDFGCAYSNIVTLAQVQFDEVKIDKSLIDNLLTNENNRIIVENVIKMSNSLKNTETLAEGVEIEEQANLLREFGCNNVQGYFYSRPLAHEDFFKKYIIG